jgi:hypothetical protein
MQFWIEKGSNFQNLRDSHGFEKKIMSLVGFSTAVHYWRVLWWIDQSRRVREKIMVHVLHLFFNI